MMSGVSPRPSLVTGFFSRIKDHGSTVLNAVAPFSLLYAAVRSTGDALEHGVQYVLFRKHRLNEANKGLGVSNVNVLRERTEWAEAALSTGKAMVYGFVFYKMATGATTELGKMESLVTAGSLLDCANSAGTRAKQIFK